MVPEGGTCKSDILRLQGEQVMGKSERGHPGQQGVDGAPTGNFQNRQTGFGFVSEAELTRLAYGLDVEHETKRVMRDPGFRLEQICLTLYFIVILFLPPLFSFLP